jgi:hypothetical protein
MLHLLTAWNDADVTTNRKCFFHVPTMSKRHKLLLETGLGSENKKDREIKGLEGLILAIQPQLTSRLTFVYLLPPNTEKVVSLLAYSWMPPILSHLILDSTDSSGPTGRLRQPLAIMLRHSNLNYLTRIVIQHSIPGSVPPIEKSPLENIIQTSIRSTQYRQPSSNPPSQG